MALSEGSKVYKFLSAFVVSMTKIMKFLLHMQLTLSKSKRKWSTYVNLRTYAIGAW